MKKTVIYILVFSIGALLGMGYDSLHVYFGVLSYSNPHFLGESLWVFIEFGIAAVVFLFGMHQMEKQNSKFKPTSLFRCFISLLLLLVAYLITCILKESDDLIIGLLLIPGIITLLTHRDKRELLLIFTTVIIGPFFEFIISKGGFFSYTNNNYIPVWLPFLYITAAGSFIEISKYFLPNLRK